jgi:hypothetical protein
MGFEERERQEPAEAIDKAGYIEFLSFVRHARGFFARSWSQRGGAAAGIVVVARNTA